jgi:hypothetical protein
VALAELELGRRARSAAARTARPGPVLGYFSGTPSHDEDFASIARALRDVLAADPSARLLLVGPLTLPAELARFEARIERRGLVPWDRLAELVAETDVCLAPLLAERPFGAAKGEIKYLEAAAAGVPTVASATAAYRHAIHDGENGMLATTQGEWRRALGTLLADPALRARLGSAAATDVARRYGEAARARELLAIVEDVRSGLRRRGRGAAVVAPQGDGAPEERPARIALEPDARPAFPAAEADATSPPLAGGSSLVQRVRVAHDGLVRIDVHAVTFGQALARAVSLVLRREDGPVVGSATLPASELPDRRWVALELHAPEPSSAGRTYLLEITAGGARGGSTVTFGLTSGGAAADGATAGAVGAARLDGVALDGALALRAFAEWRLALGARDTAGTQAHAPTAPHDRAAGAGAFAGSEGRA